MSLGKFSKIMLVTRREPWTCKNDNFMVLYFCCYGAEDNICIFIILIEFLKVNSYSVFIILGSTIAPTFWIKLVLRVHLQIKLTIVLTTIMEYSFSTIQFP
uniref:Uncharacterized protein n=1 Tax=Arundo donax TaxID=35708 RepID=A0A0A9F908_ARUDO